MVMLEYSTLLVVHHISILDPSLVARKLLPLDPMSVIPAAAAAAGWLYVMPAGRT
jgi:hypothetical protein